MDIFLNKAFNNKSCSNEFGTVLKVFTIIISKKRSIHQTTNSNYDFENNYFFCCQGLHGENDADMCCVN